MYVEVVARKVKQNGSLCLVVVFCNLFPIIAPRVFVQVYRDI
jgi:hypothetical protein